MHFPVGIEVASQRRTSVRHVSVLVNVKAVHVWHAWIEPRQQQHDFYGTAILQRKYALGQCPIRSSSQKLTSNVELTSVIDRSL